MNPRGVPIPPPPRLDRRDSGVTAAVWGKEKYLTDGAPPRFHNSHLFSPGGDGAPPRHNNQGASPWFIYPSNCQRRCWRHRW